MYRKTTTMDPMISSPTSNEYFNSLCHLVGAILSLAGMILLIVLSALEGKWIHLISFTIFGLTMFLSFLSSCLLHFFRLFDKYKRSSRTCQQASLPGLHSGRESSLRGSSRKVTWQRPRSAGMETRPYLSSWRYISSSFRGERSFLTCAIRR